MIKLKDKLKIYQPSKEDIPYDLLLQADPSLDLLHKYLKTSICYVGEIKDIIIGTYLLRKNTPEEIELLNIAVSPLYQSKGLGTLLLKDAIINAKTLGGKRLLLGTGTFGYQLTFYQRQGFRVESVEKDFFLKNYDTPIFEDGIQHKDMLRLYMNL